MFVALLFHFRQSAEAFRPDAGRTSNRILMNLSQCDDNSCVNRPHIEHNGNSVATVILSHHQHNCCALLDGQTVVAGNFRLFSTFAISARTNLGGFLLAICNKKQKIDEFFFSNSGKKKEKCSPIVQKYQFQLHARTKHEHVVVQLDFGHRRRRQRMADGN